jgi:hypothetical protein
MSTTSSLNWFSGLELLNIDFLHDVWAVYQSIHSALPQGLALLGFS